MIFKYKNFKQKNIFIFLLSQLRLKDKYPKIVSWFFPFKSLQLKCKQTYKLDFSHKLYSVLWFVLTHANKHKSNIHYDYKHIEICIFKIWWV